MGQVLRLKPYSECYHMWQSVIASGRQWGLSWSSVDRLHNLGEGGCGSTWREAACSFVGLLLLGSQWECRLFPQHLGDKGRDQWQVSINSVSCYSWEELWRALLPTHVLGWATPALEPRCTVGKWDIVEFSRINCWQLWREVESSEDMCTMWLWASAEALEPRAKAAKFL